MKYNEVPGEDVIKTAQEALNKHNMTTTVVDSLKDTYNAVIKMVPKGAEVMTMTSVTLDKAGISEQIDESSNYNAIRPALYKLDPQKDKDKMRKLAAAPDYVLGSVHAISQDGSLFIASKTGSQLAAYVYTGGKVIFVVGAQKIVKDKDEALDRIVSYTLPLESERARKAYGADGSAVNKLLEINEEVDPERIKVIIVKESVGF